MQLSLAESLYAYDLLHKQGKLLVSKMSAEELDGEDRAVLKKFGYQYYYYYLFHYFNNLRNTNKARCNQTQESELQSKFEELVAAGSETPHDVMNGYHSALMESVKLFKFYDVIPRESSLAPVKLVLNLDAVQSKMERPVDFVFTWSMFDTERSMEIFTKMICKDHGYAYDKRMMVEFENQVIESSIIECDFALLIEMLALRRPISMNFRQNFRKSIKVDLTPKRRGAKIYQRVVWDILSSDWEITELFTRMFDDYGLDHGQIARIIYDFKREILLTKKKLVRKYVTSLIRYSYKNDLRQPFVWRNLGDDLRDERPFLLYQKLEYPVEMKNMFKTSYKERLHLMSKIKARSAG